MTLTHLILIYVIGFSITLFILHKWKEELNIDNYDIPNDDYDNWNSNAEAYAVWSLAWPLIVILFSVIIIWKGILMFSKLMQNIIEKPREVLIKRLKIGDLTIKFVLRHYWENIDPENFLIRRFDFRRKELGFWFQKNMAVGTTKKGKEAFSESNLFPSYMFGVNLVYIKFWITVDRKVLHIKID